MSMATKGSFEKSSEAEEHIGLKMHVVVIYKTKDHNSRPYGRHVGWLASGSFNVLFQPSGNVSCSLPRKFGNAHIIYSSSRSINSLYACIVDHCRLQNAII